jgi:hypothetical protein
VNTQDDDERADDEVDAAYDNAVRENEVRDVEDADDGTAADDVTATTTAQADTDVDEDEVATAEADEDRAWAAEHATELRAGSTNLDEDHPGNLAEDHPDDLAEDRTDEPADEAVAVDAADEPVVVGGPAEAAAEAHEVEEHEAADSLPGSVDVAAVGAIWADDAVEGLRTRWRELQLRFIDDPRAVAGEADELVGEAVDTITNALQAQRRELTNWQNEPGDDTERLRAAVRGYRDYLDRLLGM